MRNPLKSIENLIYESVPEHAIILAVVLSVGVCFISEISLWTKITAIGCVFGATFTLVQWASDRKVKRAELFNCLIKKITSLKLNELAEVLEKCLDAKESERLEEEIMDKVPYLSYVAYLRETSVLTDAEFNALRLDVVRNLEHYKIVDLILDACEGNKNYNFLPYSYLLQYGAENCKEDVARKYQDLLDKHKKSASFGSKCKFFLHLHTNILEIFKKHLSPKKVKENGKSNKKEQPIVEVGSSQTYKTHLEVLNEIFKFNYRAHMRGAARLPDGSMVWFPNYIEGLKREKADDKEDSWVNVLNKQEKILLEYCPKSYKLTEEKYMKDHYGRRFVFGKNTSKPEEGYRFLGVYTAVEKGNDYICYKLISDKLNKKDVEQSLSPVNA